VEKAFCCPSASTLAEEHNLVSSLEFLVSVEAAVDSCKLLNVGWSEIYVVKVDKDLQRPTEVCEACRVKQRPMATEYGCISGQNAWRNFSYTGQTGGLLFYTLLWPPYEIGGHYIFALWLLSFYLSFFSSPNLSGQRFDVCHTSTHGVALVRI